jgi:septal ring factor EnvC (AmiA/AmiB activator)
MDSVSAEMDGIRSKLVEAGRSAQAQEGALQRVETQINELSEEQVILEERLETDRASIARLIMAMERIRRIPPQAIIMKPEAPLKTAQSVMLLGDIIPQIDARAQNLRQDLQRQAEIAQTLETQRKAALERKEKLNQQYASLTDLSKERERLYQSMTKDYKAQEIEIERITRSAQNLKDLMQRIEQQNREQQERTARQANLSASADGSATATNRAPRSITQAAIPPSSGAAVVPVSGIIRTHYNDLDRFGAKSEGVRIEGRPSGVVLAPMAGVIRFAGAFRNYDNMVIIEHANGYHSLVAGLEKIQTRIGQTVDAGEPIGVLKSATNNGKPTLYYELRLNGVAVNPALKFADLG